MGFSCLTGCLRYTTVFGRPLFVKCAPDSGRYHNGLVFGSQRYVAAANNYGLKQEYITPYTPQENGMCERLIRTVKEECVWQHRFKDLEEARTVIRGWIGWYNTKRPHSALDYQTPSDYASKCRGSTSVAA